MGEFRTSQAMRAQLCLVAASHAANRLAHLRGYYAANSIIEYLFSEMCLFQHCYWLHLSL